MKEILEALFILIIMLATVFVGSFCALRFHDLRFPQNLRLECPKSDDMGGVDQSVDPDEIKPKGWDI